MKITATGASGFVGSFLSAYFRQKGYDFVGIDKEDFASNALHSKLTGSDVVINLAGAPIINKWTEDYKKVLFSSRVTLTDKLVSALSALPSKPSLFISTSAIGVYRNGGPHTEERFEYDSGFLGKLALAWETSALKAQELSIRTVIFRFAVVIGRDGGALAQMLPVFKLGLGGKIGSGKQPFSWVHILDIARAYEFAISNDQISGVYNLSAPNPVTNEVLTNTLSEILRKPAFLTVPAFALRLKYGDGAVVLTEGQEVYPDRLLRSGFEFKFKTLKEALQDVL